MKSILKTYLDRKAFRFRLDRQGKILSMDGRFLRFLHLSRDVLQGRNWLEDFVFAEDRCHVKAYMDNLWEGRVPLFAGLDYQRYLVNVAGHAHSVLWFHSLVEEKGQVVAIEAVGIEEPLSEEDLLREQYLHALVTEARDGMLISDAQTAEVVVTNNAMAQLLGSSQEKILGRKVFHFSETASNLEQWQRGVAILSASPEGLTLVTRHKRDDGTSYLAEISSRYVQSHNRAFVVTVVRDVTKREAVQQKVAEQQSRFEIMMDALPIYIWQKDHLGKYVYMNDNCRHLLEDLSVQQTQLPQEVADPFLQQDVQTLQTKKPQTFEYPIETPRGKRLLQSFIQPFYQGTLGYARDVTDERHQEAMMQMLGQVLEHSPELIFFLGHDHSIKYLNQSAKSCFQEDALTHNFIDYLQQFKANSAQIFQLVNAIENNLLWSGEIHCVISDAKKSQRVFMVQLLPTEGMTALEGICTQVIMTDLTQLRQYESHLDVARRMDTLTGLYNRNAFLEQLQLNLHRHPQAALVLLDVEKFKVFNDAFGSGVGDDLLRAVALRLKTWAESPHLVGRFSADLFAVFMPVSQETKCGFIGDLNHLRDILSQGIRLKGEEHRLSFRMGVALTPEDATEPLDLLKKAELALDLAKSSSLQTAFFEPQLADQLYENFFWELQLKQAVDHEEFEVYYQPKFNGHDGEIIGAEALMRWRHPQLGLVSPGQFMQVAEATGLIRAMDELIYNQACNDWQELLRSGLQPGVLSCNASLHDLQTDHFATDWLGRARYFRLSPQHLQIEVLETAFVRGDNLVMEQILTLKRAGFSIAIDDFGQGYSSLARLKYLPADEVKIDMSFIESLEDDIQDQETLRHLVELMTTLQKVVIIEGVEREGQRDILLELGAQNHQGYWYAKPMPFAAFKNLLETSKNLHP